MSLDEQWKYERCYELETYRMGPARFNYASADVASFGDDGTYLDVGCGRGEMLELAIGQGLLAVGVETVPQLCDEDRVFHGDICDLGWPNKTFDFVTCYDVLEHLPPGEEQDALDELFRVCRKVLCMSTNDRNSFLPDGTDLHVNKRPMASWDKDIRDRAKACGAEVRYTAAGPKGDWHWRVTFP